MPVIIMQKKTFHIMTFGCQMNVRDSRWLETVFMEAGFHAGSLENADIILINTCSVREKPERKVVNILNQIKGLTRSDPDVLVMVTGCVAQQLGKQLFEYSPQVRYVAGSDGLVTIMADLRQLLDNPQLKLARTDFLPAYPERSKVAEKWPNSAALVNIMQGCDNFCAYCIVPYTRGRQKSRHIKDIINECKSAIENGATDLTLLGQNVNAWGKDNGAGSFSDLLVQVADLPALRRLHFVTPHPADMDQRTIEAFKYVENLCPRLHLPLQAGSDRILARMGRRYDRKTFLELVERLRVNRPDLALSTDLIVGFPGETEADFQDTLDMMKECQFMSSFSFCYSDRPGTRASRMTDKIPVDIKHERLLRLQELQDWLDQDWLNGRLNTSTSILLEKPASRSREKTRQWQGRDPYGAIVNVELPGAAAGEYKKVHIYEASKHSLKGIVLEG